MSYEYTSRQNTFLERELRFQELRRRIELETMILHTSYDYKTKGNGIFNLIQEPKWVRLEKFKESVKNYKV